MATVELDDSELSLMLEVIGNYHALVRALARTGQVQGSEREKDRLYELWGKISDAVPGA